MNHQPYERWIFESDSLTHAEQEALATHLATCKECARLRQKWSQLEEEALSSPVMLAPQPGFTRRWRHSLIERRQREQRRQAWRFFLFLVAATTLVFLSLVCILLLTTSPTEWIQAAVHTLATTASTFAAARGLAFTWLSLAPASLNIIIGIALGLSFSILVLIWTFAIWKTALTGVWNR
ncbi:MAG TPA: hypothetical protein DEQ80_09205 [Anaerolinea thermolimosa]|uniref:Zinc-finger domain-containing protein n=1 Tax=Anaerolinea thermolimosa TaxID=229919 RepID=A0A3D1JHR0_9CHLR|nr:hypothetical protein [Anaerolinea thermolimosa]GAP07155.1 hypothetical protein ATHL_02023 [Anaerolinea thermolimosa]HCE18023.1 hypothetical protein [Anaerolinea thermolimosa]